MRRNKRGDIPITILVIGVFVVCTLAILSFFASSISLRNSFAGVDIVKGLNEDMERAEFNKIDLGNDGAYREKNKSKYSLDYVARGFKDELLFSVEYREF